MAVIRLIPQLRDREEWLMARILHYAKLHGFTPYTSTLLEAWRASIAGLTESLALAAQAHPSPPELSPDDDYGDDPAAAFGVLEARRHRARGITLAMFLGLFKYYRQAYVDLLDALECGDEQRAAALPFLHRCFDRIEIAFASEWTARARPERLAELQAANRVLANEKNVYLTIFESMTDGAILVDAAGRVRNMNHRAAELCSRAATPGAVYYRRALDPQAAGLDTRDLPQADREPLTALFPWLAAEYASFAASPDTVRIHEYDRSLGGVPRHFEARFANMLDVSEKFQGALIILSDVTERRLAAEMLRESRDALQRIAYFDALTGLPNRSLFLQRLEQAIAQSERTGAALGLMFLDLDNFKDVNDSLGHRAGDELLREASIRLRNAVRRSDTVARLGGDEFTVVLTNLTQSGNVARIAEKTLAALSRPYLLAGQERLVTVSIGLSLHPLDGAPDAETVVRYADLAMYDAKRSGKNAFRRFSPEMLAD